MLTVANGKEQNWAEMPLEDLAFGNAMDCDFTLRLYHDLREVINEKNLHHIYDKLIKKSMVILTETEFHGMNVDTEYLDVLDDGFTRKKEEVLEELYEASPFKKKFNPRSSLEIIGILFSEEGYNLLPVKFNSKSQKPCVDKKDLSIILYEVKQAIQATSP